MRVSEIIRDILNIIEKVEAGEEPAKPVSLELEPAKIPDENHFKQILDLMSPSEPSVYANEPAEKVADIDSVTVHAGGGVNGPKHPADLRGNSFQIFPGL